MKKILVIAPLSTTNWGTVNAGGIDSVCQMLCKQLQLVPSNNFIYRIIAFDPLNKVIQEGKIEKINNNFEIIKFNIKKKNRLILQTPNLLYQILRIREQVSDYKPDLIHSHLNSWTIFLGSNAPIILTLHSYKKICRKRGNLLNNIFYELIIPFLSGQFVTRYTSVSEFLKNYVILETNKKIDVVYNPIDDKFFSNTTRKENDITQLVTCALITKRKGIHHSIKVVKRLVDLKIPAQLRIIGPISDKEYYNYLQEVVDRYDLGKHIFFIGPKSIDEIVEIYNDSDIGLFLSEEETFGLVPLEMMASNLSVICSETGVISDFSNRGKRYKPLNIVIPTEYDSIAELICNISTTKELCNNVFIRDAFSSSKVVSCYESIYLNEISHRD